MIESPILPFEYIGRELLFSAHIPVFRHVTKKNNRKIWRPKNNHQKLIIGKSELLMQAEKNIKTYLIAAKSNYKTAKFPFIKPMQLVCYFYFDNFLTKKNQFNLKIPDLSNLYQLVEDELQSTQIIDNDCWIFSHSGSERRASNKNYLDLFLFSYPFQF